jgi:hypothetical protein
VWLEQDALHLCHRIAAPLIQLPKSTQIVRPE